MVRKMKVACSCKRLEAITLKHRYHVTRDHLLLTVRQLEIYIAYNTAYSNHVYLVPPISNPRQPGTFIHSIWIITSPDSTFLNLRIMSCRILPLSQTTQLSSARQLFRLGLILETTQPFGRFCNPIFRLAIYALMSISASPILSSTVNLSLSKTVCKGSQNRRNQNWQ